MNWRKLSSSEMIPSISVYFSEAEDGNPKVFSIAAPIKKINDMAAKVMTLIRLLQIQPGDSMWAGTTLTSRRLSEELN